MKVNILLQFIDAEIAKLKKLRAEVEAIFSVKAHHKQPAKRKLSKAGRAAISRAAKRRWAAVKAKAKK